MEPNRALEAKPDAAAWPRPPAAAPALGPIDGFGGLFLLEVSARTAYGQASGILSGLPDAVAVPRDADDVAAVVRWAAARGQALIPRAAGTGMPGGNVGRGVAVDLHRFFRAAPEIDAPARTARVQPGVTLAELNRAAAGDGLLFPVDPSSGDRATFGGIVANNSGGSHTVLHGSARAWIQSLDLVLADGTRVATTRGEGERDPRLAEILAPVDEMLATGRGEILARWPRVRKNSSGYALKEYLESGDAVDLLVGSEGTLALVTGATVRLAPMPRARGLALVEFTDLAAAGAAVEQILTLRPSTCEIIDRTFIDLVRQGDEDPGYPLREGLEAILFVEMEGDSEDEVAARLRALETAMAGVADRVSIATDAAQRERFWHVRHAASPMIAKLAGHRVSMQFIEDGVVPVARLADYIRLLRRILGERGLPAVIFGHAGDGNLHVNPLVDVKKPRWREEVEEVVYEVAEGVAALGGTMTGEHGDGRLRAPLLETIWGTEMVARFRAVKDAFDPAGILNPGVILPLPGQRPLDGIRY
ncbi:FAD-binding oxidoreductase [Longimicrobium sp.]|uniref:FAD-binding oxidoreductase n=1 Tax=Longimicrobium sp. TaxID=2029185 RepID=UPI002C053840|nr:FAD-binding oxidoreductase [Longimicrobium sp.]HSU15048.1 FAD-binding oxidoreductase [Longimicrobium sp.]